MATIELPDELVAEIKAKAEEAATELMHELLVDASSRFVDVTTMSTPGKEYMHVLTGRVLCVKAEWKDLADA